jgi:hypothetical protein
MGTSFSAEDIEEINPKGNNHNKDNNNHKIK